MIITWYGQACFKIQAGEIVLALDPFSKDIGLTPPRFKTDVVAVTHAHFDHNNVAALSGDPFVITGPGEYEMKGMRVQGISTYHDNKKGAIRGLNTIYAIELEGIRLLHMGDFGEDEIRNEWVERAGAVDILMLPVGGVYTIQAETAAKVVKQIEPKIVIPMHYKIPGLKPTLEPVSAFLKEMGAAAVSPQEKLVIKKRDFGEDEKTKVVVLKNE